MKEPKIMISRLKPAPVRRRLSPSGPGLVLFALVLILPLPTFCLSQEPYPRENAVVRAVSKVSSAVVNISTTRLVKRGANPFFSMNNEEFFNRFFRDFFESHKRRQVQNSLGSGVIIDSENKYVLTNHHVIVRASKVIITLADEQEFEAKVVGTDPESDLAVLKIEADSDIPSIALGKSDDLMIGETVIAIGNPFGLSHTVTTGVISALNRSVKAESGIYHSLIQIDASINPGNSGGPLLNINGELIGINTAIYSGAEGIGFAIPIDRARMIVSDLINYGQVHTAWLGLIVQNVDENLAEYFGLSATHGALITETEAGSPGKKGGLNRGELITKLNGQKIRSARDYYARLSQYTAGEKIRLEVLSGGERKDVFIKAGSFPNELVPEFAFDRLGFKVEEVDAKLARKYGLREENGVVISEIRKGSRAAGIGLAPGDLVRGINELSVDGIRDFDKAIIRYRLKEKVTVLIQRGWSMYSVSFRM